MAALAVTLTGCDSNEFQGSMSIQQSSTGLVIAVCTDGNYKSLFASSENQSEGAGWARFWEASGRFTTTTGQVMVVGAPIGGISPTLSERPRVTPGSKLAFTFASATKGEIEES